LLSIGGISNICNFIGKLGGSILISQDQYLSTHYLLNWYAAIEDLTPETPVFLMYHTDIANQSYLVNFRIYDKREGKTKNEYFLEIVTEVQSWGLKPFWSTGDSWYSIVGNLKYRSPIRLG
jgi:hypothetical protein